MKQTVIWEAASTRSNTLLSRLIDLFLLTWSEVVLLCLAVISTLHISPHVLQENTVVSYALYMTVFGFASCFLLLLPTKLGKQYRSSNARVITQALPLILLLFLVPALWLHTSWIQTAWILVGAVQIVIVMYRDAAAAAFSMIVSSLSLLYFMISAATVFALLLMFEAVSVPVVVVLLVTPILLFEVYIWCVFAFVSPTKIKQYLLKGAGYSLVLSVMLFVSVFLIGGIMIYDW